MLDGEEAPRAAIVRNDLIPLYDSLALDRTELEDAIWVDRAGIEAALAGEPGAPFLAPPPFAIAYTLLERWLDQAEKRSMTCEA